MARCILGQHPLASAKYYQCVFWNKWNIVFVATEPSGEKSLNRLENLSHHKVASGAQNRRAREHKFSSFRGVLFNQDLFVGG